MIELGSGRRNVNSYGLESPKLSRITVGIDHQIKITPTQDWQRILQENNEILRSCTLLISEKVLKSVCTCSYTNHNPNLKRNPTLKELRALDVQDF